MGIALHIVSRDPLILHGYDWQCGVSPFTEIATAILDQPAHFLLSLSWTLLERQRLEQLLRAYQQYRALLPHHEFTVLANMPEEKKLLDHFRVPSVLCPHNALLDENEYPAHSAEKIYTAVINARIARFKRIHLARDVPSTCLITYVPPQHEEDYEHELRAGMPHMAWPQYENGRYVRYFSQAEVARVYARSGCGLILSAIEGGCFAATEYLLCGLPVVSTPSIGGRDIFFHSDYVTLCEPTHDAVRRAVDAALACPVPPEEIRARTLARMERYRKSYVALLHTIARRAGRPRSFETDWPRIFTNKMLTWHPDKNSAVRALVEAGVADAT